MIRKVLVINDNNENLCGLLTLESDESLHGKLKFFKDQKGSHLVVRIGDNILAFNDIDVQNFEFKTVFHELDLPICALVVFDDQIKCVAKSENSSIDENELLKEFLEQKNKVQTQMTEKEKEDEFKEKTDLKEKIENTDNFFEMIKPQFDALFEQNEHYKQLEEKLEGTEWVKVNVGDGESDHYILGKIYDGDILTHIAYGTFAKNSRQLPPQGLEEYCQFLPLDSQNEESFGYYVMYQDAITGENIVL